MVFVALVVSAAPTRSKVLFVAALNGTAPVGLRLPLGLWALSLLGLVLLGVVASPLANTLHRLSPNLGVGVVFLPAPNFSIGIFRSPLRGPLFVGVLVALVVSPLGLLLGGSAFFFAGECASVQGKRIAMPLPAKVMSVTKVSPGAGLLTALHGTSPGNRHGCLCVASAKLPFAIGTIHT
jgi:hypothetical protein